MLIDDGGGQGFKAKVDSRLNLHTRSFSLSQQHAISSADQEAYQANTSIAIAASEVKLLLLKNTHLTKELVITYIQLETIGAAASNATAMWKIYVGGDYASGGGAVTPVNMNVGSPNSATGSFYDATGSTIVTSGSPLEIDRTHLANTRISFNKEGSVILPRNGVLLISFTGSTAAGSAVARVSFYYDIPEF